MLSTMLAAKRDSVLIRILFCVLVAFCTLALIPGTVFAQEHGSMDAIGAKLSNPLSDLWSLSFDFHPLITYNGDDIKGKLRGQANYALISRFDPGRVHFRLRR